MKRYKTLFSLSLVAFACTGCSSGSFNFNFEDYLLEINASRTEGFKILQLSDLHYGMSTDLVLEFTYLDKLINNASPNLIVICGDMFMDATKEDVNQTLSYFENKNIPWTVVFGNHDKQGFYKPDYIPNKLNEIENCYFKNFKDDVYGDSNFYININSTSLNKTMWQIYLLDSNSYHFNWTSYDYDIIHEDQIAWYRNAVVESKTRYGSDIPSLCYFHIPTEEFNFAIEQNNQNYADFNNELGYMEEKVCCGYKENDFVETAMELSSTKAIFVAHDHINGFALNYHYDDKDILLSYGVKTGNCLYHNDEHIGGQLVTLHDDKTFDILRIYQTYEGLL